jgi:NAD(P)-dependent dehydrogenase (short-subunit alcohol dehydrogenase family)
VVNDLGGDQGGGGADVTPAQQTVDDIVTMGGEAVVNDDNVADWKGAQRLVEQAVDTFGDLHVLINNAGILRDRVVVNMTEDEWDVVVDVHLKGHFAPSHFAANYWREQTKAGKDVNAAIVNTTSTSGLFSNPGQANYDAAKSGIATLTQVLAKELVRYGVRANAIAPAARTRLTLSTPGLGDAIAPPEDPGAFDSFNPANVSPMVAYLSTADCTITGETFVVFGGLVRRVQTWTLAEGVEQDERWTIDGLAARAGELAPSPPIGPGFMGHPTFQMGGA